MHALCEVIIRDIPREQCEVLRLRFKSVDVGFGGAAGREESEETDVCADVYDLAVAAVPESREGVRLLEPNIIEDTSIRGSCAEYHHEAISELQMHFRLSKPSLAIT